MFTESFLCRAEHDLTVSQLGKCDKIEKFLVIISYGEYEITKGALSLYLFFYKMTINT
jgi:hypothetical protein